MTPARFDLLFVVFDGMRTPNPRRRSGHTKRVLAAFEYRCSQRWIREQLGLHLSTVSKMITRLVDLGLLDESFSGRVRMVCFTERGLRLFREALKYAFGERYLAMLFKRFAWPDKKPRRQRWRIHEAVYALFKTIKQIGNALGSRNATLYVPRDRFQTPAMNAFRRWHKDLLSGRLVRRATAVGEARVDVLDGTT